MKPGYLYVVAEELGPDDLVRHPHPSNVGDWEWIVTREVPLRLEEKTVPLETEALTDEEIAAIRKRQQELGAESFATNEPALRKASELDPGEI